MDPALLRVVVASRQFQNVDHDGCCQWGLCKVIGCLGLGNVDKLTITEGPYAVVVCPWNTEQAPLVHCFLKSSAMLVERLRKMAAPHA